MGNYDYGFYWHLYLDGTIEFEAKATGIVFTARHPGAGYPYAAQIASGLAAPYHQHLFCARLDMAVDGDTNAVHELDLQRLPTSATNPHGNAFTRSRTVFTRESEAVRRAEGAVGRVWEIVNPHQLNHVGEPVAYSLIPRVSPRRPVPMTPPSAGGRRSPAITCGSPGTPRTSVTRAVTSSTRASDRPGCPRSAAPRPRARPGRAP